LQLAKLSRDGAAALDGNADHAAALAAEALNWQRACSRRRKTTTARCPTPAAPRRTTSRPPA
jgi:hypothetical protein